MATLIQRNHDRIKAQRLAEALRNNKATLKVLVLGCGCKKHICLVKDNPDLKPCSRDCSQCKDAISYEPCREHRHQTRHSRQTLMQGAIAQRLYFQ